jgi:ribonuclease D
MRVKKTVEKTPVDVFEEVIEDVDPNAEEDEVVQRVVNKLEKVITIKKVLSQKQKPHLDKLAKIREGKRYKPIEKPAPPLIPAQVPVKKEVKKPVKKVIKEIQQEVQVKPEVFLSRFNRKLF